MKRMARVSVWVLCACLMLGQAQAQELVLYEANPNANVHISARTSFPEAATVEASVYALTLKSWGDEVGEKVMKTQNYEKLVMPESQRDARHEGTRFIQNDLGTLDIYPKYGEFCYYRDEDDERYIITKKVMDYRLCVDATQLEDTTALAGLTKQAAERMTADFLEAMGIDWPMEMTITAFHLPDMRRYAQEYNGYAMDKLPVEKWTEHDAFYCVQLIPTVDGIPLDPMDYDMYNGEIMIGNIFSVLIDEKGVFYCIPDGCFYELQEEVEKLAIINIEEAIEIVSSFYADILLGAPIEIVDIRLQYVVVKAGDELVLRPAWCFGYYNSADNMDRAAYWERIDALTGKRIQ
ncbi:MAG: hypothetical protein RSC06_03915 [Clostridia bacterium]